MRLVRRPFLIEGAASASCRRPTSQVAPGAADMAEPGGGPFLDSTVRRRPGYTTSPREAGPYRLDSIDERRRAVLVIDPCSPNDVVRFR